jgi:hypothetical protein
MSRAGIIRIQPFDGIGRLVQASEAEIGDTRGTVE